MNFVELRILIIQGARTQFVEEIMSVLLYVSRFLKVFFFYTKASLGRDSGILRTPRSRKTLYVVTCVCTLCSLLGVPFF